MEKTAYDQSDWLAQARKERKGADPVELDWQIGPQLSMTPHLTREESPAQAPLRLRPGWEIGTYVAAGDTASVNAAALSELEGGAEALLFNLHDQPDEAEIGQMLSGIQAEFVSLHCNLYYPERDPAVLFRDLIFYLRSQNYDLQKISGSVDFDPLLDWGEPPWPPLLRLLNFASKYMPNFRVLQVNGKAFNTGPQDSDTELSLIIAKGAEYLHQLQERGVNPALANRHLQFAVTQGTTYFVEIAKLRALRILWANVLQGFGVEGAGVMIASHTDPSSFGEDTNQNLLRLSTQGMAAVVGGADLVFLRPPDAPPSGVEQATDFGRRMARNVQQLLRLEAGFDEFEDPAAGSYYLDQLTEKMATSAWQQFLEIEAKGGFAAV
ncbi:MAG: methylmalonyl-CoA mutase family protein [Bacteroidota bacterium]